MKRTLCFALLIAALALPAAPLTAATGGKHKSLFSDKKPSTPPSDPQALKCDTLKKGVTQHLDNMKRFNAQIQAERQRPSDLEGLFDKWSGSNRTAALSELNGKLARERRTAEEIAALLPAYKCPPVDIDAELKTPLVDPQKNRADCLLQKSHEQELLADPSLAKSNPNAASRAARCGA
jgi:hypothetical protein